MYILKELRKKNNLKQYEVAELIGMSKRQYLKYENNQIKPNYKVVEKLSKIYNLEIKELYIMLLESPISRL